MSLSDHSQSWNFQEPWSCSCRYTLMLFFSTSVASKEVQQRTVIISLVTAGPPHNSTVNNYFSYFCEAMVEFAIFFLSAITRVWGSGDYNLCQCLLSRNSDLSFSCYFSLSAITIFIFTTWKANLPFLLPLFLLSDHQHHSFRSQISFPDER